MSYLIDDDIDSCRGDTVHFGLSLNLKFSVFNTSPVSEIFRQRDAKAIQIHFLHFLEGIVSGFCSVLEHTVYHVQEVSVDFVPFCAFHIYWLLSYNLYLRMVMV